MINLILKTLKVNHYIKNLVVFVPLIFSVNFTNLKCIFYSLIIFSAFCLISSAAYILNDLADINEDKKHPVKCQRPIASGKISIPFAVLILIILIILSSLISFMITPSCLVMVLAYLMLNILYSLYLKKLILIDMATIALGFIIRIVAGCFAISVLPSPLVILMTFFVSNFFTCAKRRLEIKILDKSIIRKSLKDVNINTINNFLMMNAVLSISFYITYVLDDATIQRAGSQYLYLTVIPFALIIFRLFFMIDSKQTGDDPIVYLEKDKMIKWLALFYIVVIALVLWIK